MPAVAGAIASIERKETGPSMTAESAIFTCSICGERSSEICVYCTKDSCVNHRCHRCKRCSDCCECEVPLSAAEVEMEQEPAPEVAAAIIEPSAPEAAPAAEPPVSQPGEEILP